MKLSILPTAGMIVSCSFPYEEDPSKPSGDIRPVLIVSVMKSGKVMVTCGSAAKTNNTTTFETKAPYHYDVDISFQNGLKETTRFNFIKTIPLEWNTDWFVPFKGRNTIKIGNLTNTEMVEASKAKSEAESFVIKNPLKNWPKVPQLKESIKLTIKKRTPRPPLDDGPETI